jgi:hypothetical protein
LGGYKLKCNKCGSENNETAVYCKSCGATLKDEENFIVRMNGKLNLLAVISGLIVFIIVLFITSILFMGLVTSKTIPAVAYILLVLVVSVFFGSILTGALGSKTIDDGYINGCFFSLVILVLAGLLVSFIFLAVMGVASTLASAFGSAGSFLGSGTSGALSSLNSTSSASGVDGLNLILDLVELIASIVLILVSGAIGGALGVFIKDQFKPGH